jgi:hypothetical protein
MTRRLVILDSKVSRNRTASWVKQAPHDTRVEFKPSKRSLPQNDRMWAMLTDVARHFPWLGMLIAPDDWKLIFHDALEREVHAVPWTGRASSTRTLVIRPQQIRDGRSDGADRSLRNSAWRRLRR